MSNSTSSNSTSLDPVTEALNSKPLHFWMIAFPYIWSALLIFKSLGWRKAMIEVPKMIFITSCMATLCHTFKKLVVDREPENQAQRIGFPIATALGSGLFAFFFTSPYLQVRGMEIRRPLSKATQLTAIRGVIAMVVGVLALVFKWKRDEGKKTWFSSPAAIA